MFTSTKLSKLRSYFGKKAKPVSAEGDPASTGSSGQSSSISHAQGWKQIFAETQVIPNCTCVFCTTMRAHDAQDTHEMPVIPSQGPSRPQSYSSPPSVPPMASVYDVLYPSRRAPLETRGNIPISTSHGEESHTGLAHIGTRPQKVPAGSERQDPRYSRARRDGYFTGTLDSTDTPPPYSKCDPIRRIGSAPHYIS